LPLFFVCLFWITYASITSVGSESLVFGHSADSLFFLSFLDFANKNIQAAAITKQLIHTIGLTAIHANQITTNHTTNVKQNAINLVQAHTILARNGRTLAKVSINCIIIENAQNIRSNPINLIIQVHILLAC
jgi:hypothetical protein